MITKEKIRARIRSLNDLLGRPNEYWYADDKQSPGTIAIGHLSMEYRSGISAPYALVETVTESGGETQWGPSMSAGEMWLFLQGMETTIALQNKLKMLNGAKPVLTLVKG